MIDSFDAARFCMGLFRAFHPHLVGELEMSGGAIGPHLDIVKFSDEIWFIDKKTVLFVLITDYFFENRFSAKNAFHSFWILRFQGINAFFDK